MAVNILLLHCPLFSIRVHRWFRHSVATSGYFRPFLVDLKLEIIPRRCGEGVEQILPQVTYLWTTPSSSTAIGRLYAIGTIPASIHASKPGAMNIFTSP